MSQKNLLQAVETNLFADLWTPDVTSDSSNETGIFNGLLQQSNVSLHDRACAARTADLCGNERADAAKATLRIKNWVFFCSGEAAHLVRVLVERSRLDWTYWDGPCVDSDCYVKGTREPAPSRIPQSKYDALFDKRHVFDAIRESFLFSAGTLDAMVILLEAMASDRNLSPAARAQLEKFPIRGSSS